MRNYIKKFLKNKIPLLSIIYHNLLSLYYKNRNVAKTATIDKSVHVLGWRSIRIESNSIVSEGTWLNVNREPSHTPQIIIEQNSFVGRRNFLSSGALIRLGSFCLTGPDCKFLGSNHIINDPFKPYVTTGATNSSIIDIGVNCWIGAGAVILGSVKIGHGSIIGVNTLVNSDIPPFSIVVGNPGQIIKRYNMQSKCWEPAESVSAEDLIHLPSEEVYISLLKDAHSTILLPLRASGKRMGDLP